MKEHNRIVFYSIYDGASGYQLRKAEIFLQHLDLEQVSDLNDLLEIHQIKLYFDNTMFLTTWDEQTKVRFMEQADMGFQKLRKLLLGISDENFIQLVTNLEFSFRSSFWYMFNYLQVYRRIGANSFSAALQQHPHHISYILEQFNTIQHYEQELRQFLIGYEKAAELLLARFEQRGRFNESKAIFPKALTLADREQILSAYLDQERPNLNYVRLIEHSKNSGHLELSNKVRLKAKQKSAAINSQVLAEGNPKKIGVEVSLNSDQQEPVVVKQEGLVTKIVYSTAYLDNITTDVQLFLLFRNLFEFVDNNWLVTLVSKADQISVLERTLITSKN
ncbi:MAG: hypothetical protein ABI480_00370, partial [Chitinophagaceae bacterium]